MGGRKELAARPCSASETQSHSILSLGQVPLEETDLPGAFQDPHLCSGADFHLNNALLGWYGIMPIRGPITYQKSDLSS